MRLHPAVFGLPMLAMLMLSGCGTAAQAPGPKIYTQGKQMSSLPAGVPLLYPHLAGFVCTSVLYLPAAAKPLPAPSAILPANQGMPFWQLQYTCHAKQSRAPGIFVMEVPDESFPAEGFGVTARIRYKGRSLLAGTALVGGKPARAMAFMTGSESTFVSRGERVTRPVQVDLLANVSVQTLEEFAASIRPTP